MSSSSNVSSVSSIGVPTIKVEEDKTGPGYVTVRSDDSQEPLIQRMHAQTEDVELELVTGQQPQANISDNKLVHESTPLQIMNNPTLAVQGLNHQGDNISYANQFFRDTLRRVDYVLVYNKVAGDASGDSKSDISERKWRAKRACFEENLRLQGLEIELETVDKPDVQLCFVKVHGPWEIMAKQAELLHLKMPIKRNDIRERNIIKGCLSQTWRTITQIHQLEDKYKVDEFGYFTAPFVAERAHQFVMPDKDAFFNCSQRSRMVYDILIRTRYDNHRPDRVGIERLIANASYAGAYPLHESLHRKHAIPRRLHVRSRVGEAWQYDSGLPIDSKPTDRQLLYETWASPRTFYKYQPLDLIRKYFGEKVSLYFAWLGFYTSVLVPASLIGLICVIYGAWSINSDYYPGAQICDDDHAGNYTMCPLCEYHCDFWKLKKSCAYAQVTHIFDNTATVVFAVFMSIWATLFLEGWKRYLAELSWKWDLFDFELQEERIRPEFQTRVKGKRTNPVTQEHEPFLPMREKILRWLASGVTVIFFLCLVLAFVIGVIIYRVIINKLLNEAPYLQSYSKWVTSVTAATLNLICIILLGRFYQALAWKLTDWEFPRTETEFENSYTFKVFLFQFINYYSSLFYIAFFKGKLSSLPSSSAAVSGDNVRLFGEYQLEACDPAGCMVELVIQLGIIMVGKQFFNNFMEILFPILWNWWRRRTIIKMVVGDTVEEENSDDNDETLHRMAQWEKDYTLNPVPDDYMFNEYLEMVIQFGFVTLFVAAFPLAPLFALLNNIMEVRLDAYKFCVAYRRPQPVRSKDLGIWTTILDGLSKMAVLTNACVIAFTSDFVPRVLYIATHYGSTTGFMDWSLSYFNASLLRTADDKYLDKNVTFCRFRDFRKPPCALPVKYYHHHADTDCDDNYGFSIDWWHVFAAKLAFVLVFEHFVFLIKGLVAYLIPDLPTSIFVKLQREAFLSRQARREYELQLQRRSKQNGVPTTPTSDNYPRSSAVIDAELDIVSEDLTLSNE